MIYKNKIALILLFFASVNLATAESVPAHIAGMDLSSLSHKTITLKHSKGSVIAFLSARCPCSQSHEASLTNLAIEFPDFQFIGVHSNADESESMAITHFQKSALPFPVIQDNESTTAIALGALKTPHVFVLGPDLEILFSGGIDNSQRAQNATKFFLRDTLLAIKQGKKPAERFVRTLGCNIARP